MAQTQDIGWVNNLPEGGRTWGQSLVATVDSLDTEIASLEEEKARVTAQIKDRRKLRNATAKRADREAPSLFHVEEINAAKALYGSEHSVEADVNEDVQNSAYSAAQ